MFDRRASRSEHNIKIIISITIIGESKPNKTTYRSGAKPGDLLVVSGDLGGAYLGLQILERENTIFEQHQKSQPILDQYSYILEKQLKPEARTDIIYKLDQLNIAPTSMIDISDGLSSESQHLLANQPIGIKIFENKIPISDEVKKVAIELNIDTITCALYGGEEYEILFTMPPLEYAKIENDSDLTAIGHVTSSKGNLELITRSNQIINLNEGGWDSFSKNNNTNI